MKKTSSELLLLDVNVLLSLAWPNHQFHSIATQRFKSKRDRWATCAITQLGFIRLSSNPSAVSPPQTPRGAAQLLRGMVADSAHVYLPRLLSPLETGRFDRIMGGGQVTDAYLLGLAHAHNARFITFDRRLRALAGQDQLIEILGV